MTPESDRDLLRQFVEHQSDAAFAGLVERHAGLVHSVAFRQVGDAHHAEEITQAVFIIFAQKAATLRHEPALTSWLFQTTRLTANNFLRSILRRRQREQEAYMQSTLNETAADVWPHIAPLLDTAVEKLSEPDRRAILMRFYEGRNLREVGIALGASEDTATKRVNRALEKLRKFFSKRGVTLSVAAIAGAVSANSVQAAPVALTKTLAAVAISKGSIAPASTLTLVKGTLKLMAWLKTKTVIAYASGTVLAGAAVLTWEQQVENNRQQERAIRAEEQQIRARETNADLSPADKAALDGRLNQLRTQQNKLRAAQSQLLEQSTNVFMRPSKQVSPFTHVRFAGEKVFVTYLGNESELAAVNGQSTADILAFCREKYGGREMQRRFAEDLVVVLADMGHPAGDDNTVSLALLDPGTGTKQDVAHAQMTAENRLAVYSALHPAR